MRLYAYPADVENLINLVNGCGVKKMEIFSANEEEDILTSSNRLSEIVDGFEPIARDYIWDDSPEDDIVTKIENAIRRYDILRTGQELLQRIVNLSRPPLTKRSSIIRLASSAVTLDEVRLAKTGKSYRIKDELITPYEIQIVKHRSPLNALDHCPARIRRCEAIRCGKFFWAARDDQRGCDKKCGAAIRQAEKRKRKKQ